MIYEKNCCSLIGFILLLIASFPSGLFADTIGDESLQEDYSKTALPILQQSCFACHGPKPQSIDGIQDPKLRKKAVKAVIRAQKTFPMAETFPFPESEDSKDDLKIFSKSLRKSVMPPKYQKTLNMGQPLSALGKKALLDWAARTRKALK
jgi:hypothetical protein